MHRVCPVAQTAPSPSVASPPAASLPAASLLASAAPASLESNIGPLSFVARSSVPVVELEVPETRVTEPEPSPDCPDAPTNPPVVASPPPAPPELPALVLA
jgi:hypothetical protein